MGETILPCKLIAQVAFKAGGDVFHDIMANKPHQFADASPATVKSCDLHEGSFGQKGSIIEWKYTLDGKEHATKEVVEEVDTEKKVIVLRAFEGSLMDLYKNLCVTIHVETKDGVDYIIWTIDYELMDPKNPHPVSVLNMFIELTNDIEAHITK